MPRRLLSDLLSQEDVSSGVGAVAKAAKTRGTARQALKKTLSPSSLGRVAKAARAAQDVVDSLRGRKRPKVEIGRAVLEPDTRKPKVEIGRAVIEDSPPAPRGPRVEIGQAVIEEEAPRRRTSASTASTGGYGRVAPPKAPAQKPPARASRGSQVRIMR